MAADAKGLQWLSDTRTTMETVGRASLLCRNTDQFDTTGRKRTIRCRCFEKTNGRFADITLPDLRVELAWRYSDSISGGGMRLARYFTTLTVTFGQTGHSKVGLS
jgi:hypothetical protein